MCGSVSSTQTLLWTINILKSVIIPNRDTEGKQFAFQMPHYSKEEKVDMILAGDARGQCAREAHRSYRDRSPDFGS